MSYVIKYNSRNKKHMVFYNTGQGGFGSWKIIKGFNSESEAKDFIKAQG